MTTDDIDAVIAGLVERCEAATGPDRELDALIAAGCRLGAENWPWADGYPAWGGTADGRVYLEHGGAYFKALLYTASLDAAMTLVPEGMAWILYSDGPTYRASAEVGSHPVGGALFTASHSSDGETPALALCAAAIRTRLQKQEP